MPADLSTRHELRAFFARGYWQCSCGGYRLTKPDLEACPDCGTIRPDGPSNPSAAPAAQASVPAEKQSKKPAMTKTEMEAQRLFCPPGARFEGVTFAMSNGHRYTPDFVWWGDDGRMTCMEVKGSFRLGSYQRAKLAFDQCKAEFPQVTWVWKERQKDGSWK